MPTIRRVMAPKGAARATHPRATAKDTLSEYILQDNQDGSFNIFGVNAAGAQVDISGVATLTPPPASSDATVLTVDPPAGMLVPCHGLKAGTAEVTVTATWNDNSVGPFTITAPADVKQDPVVVGLGVTFGTPTIR